MLGGVQMWYLELLRQGTSRHLPVHLHRSICSKVACSVRQPDCRFTSQLPGRTKRVLRRSRQGNAATYAPVARYLTWEASLRESGYLLEIIPVDGA